MKVKVQSDEWYPVYSIVKDGDYNPYSTENCELTAEQVAFVRKAEEDFDKAQNILRRSYEKAAKLAAELRSK